MWAYIGRKAHAQNIAYINRVRATGELNSGYEALVRLRDKYGSPQELIGRPILRLVTSEDQQ